MNPKFWQGALYKSGKKTKSNGGRDNIPTLADGLSELAKCDACGCNSCYGYETILNAETGELLIRYYTGEAEPYTEVVKPFDEGLALVKALYAARIA